jgi:endonuclease/exonuclease/phosphatase family metal-dependent hydrolase
VASTHLDYQFDQSAVRQLQVATVLEAVADHRGDPTADLPPIVAGDFNAIPDSDEIRMVTGRAAPPVPGALLSDCWEHVGDGSGSTWRRDNPYQVDSAWPQRRLDYVFVSWPRPKPVGNPVAAWLAGVDPVDGVVPSDHAAVVVDVLTP